MNAQPRRTPVNSIAKGEDWKNMLRTNICMLGSCKLSNISSIDQKKTNSTDAHQSNGQEKSIRKVLSNIFRRNIRDRKIDSGALIENFPSTECSNSTFSRFRYKGKSKFALKDLSRPFKSLDTIDSSRRNGIINSRSFSLKNLKNDQNNHDDLDVTRTGLHDKSTDMGTSATSCYIPNHGVRHATLNAEQLEILKKISKPCFGNSYNLVRERASDINNQDIEGRRNASL